MSSNINSIFLDECNSNEISRIINDFQNNKSSDIPIKVIKKSSHVISPVLANYFNKLMTSGTFPDVLKVGRITPIFKKDNPECIENYRPISTLPIFGKFLKKLYLSAFTALQHHKTFCIIINLVLGNHIPPVMQ